MESFYGGKSGASFVVVKSFSSVEEMVKNFQKGPEYSDVHYNEYVLINTENKNDKDNGKLYRRGYDYTNNLGGAIYVGSIVGPAGKAPMLELTTIAEVENQKNNEGEERYSSGSYAPTENLIPGKNADGTFNDAIEWACVSARDENGEDTIAYIGFKFPYLVEEFTAKSVNPYYHRDSEESGFKNTDLIERMDNGEHPYYESWHINIPQGIKGDTFKNFRVMVADNTIKEYDGQEDDIDNRRQVLVYDYYHFDKEEGGEPTTIYLGDYNMIKNISVADDGTITIDYLHDDSKIYSNLLKWIDRVTLDEKDHFTVQYNYDKKDEEGNSLTTYETDLDWVNNININSEGKVTIYWSTGKIEQLETGLRWITSMQTQADGTIIVNYNDGTHQTFSNVIKYVDSVTLDKDGTFTVKYNNGEKDYTTKLLWVADVIIAKDGTVTIVYNDGTNTQYNKLLKYIKSISINENQKFFITYNTGETEEINDIIKFIKNIYIDDDTNENSDTHDYKLHVVYNTDNDEIGTAIGQATNYILETAIDTDEKKDYHYLVYYSNGNIRDALDDNIKRTYKGKDGWLDLGSVKDDAGILIGFNIAATAENQLNNISTAIEYLNTEYPDGLTDAKNYGKIVTIGDENQNKLFYAFDYNKHTWYYLGTFNNDSVWIILGHEDDSDIETQKSKLSIGGVWFIVENK